jgi:hypothetical protein
MCPTHVCILRVVHSISAASHLRLFSTCGCSFATVHVTVALEWPGYGLNSLGVDFWQVKDNFLFSKQRGPVMGHTQPCIQ